MTAGERKIMMNSLAAIFCSLFIVVKHFTEWVRSMHLRIQKKNHRHKSKHKSKWKRTIFHWLLFHFPLLLGVQNWFVNEIISFEPTVLEFGSSQCTTTTYTHTISDIVSTKCTRMLADLCVTHVLHDLRFFLWSETTMLVQYRKLFRALSVPKTPTNKHSEQLIRTETELNNIRNEIKKNTNNL